MQAVVKPFIPTQKLLLIKLKGATERCGLFQALAFKRKVRDTHVTPMVAMLVIAGLIKLNCASARIKKVTK